MRFEKGNPLEEPNIGDRAFTGYPFGFTHTEWVKELRYLTVAELEDTLEIKRWQVIDPDAESDAYRYFLAGQIHTIIQELERRTKLLKAHGNDPLAPKWRGGTMAKQRDRINRIKDRWPIDLFAKQSLGLRLIPIGKNTYKANCPFPNHQDSTPSFHINTEKQLGYCFGCHRGGDVIEVARWYLNTNFSEALTVLEKEGEIFDSRN